MYLVTQTHQPLSRNQPSSPPPPSLPRRHRRPPPRPQRIRRRLPRPLPRRIHWPAQTPQSPFPIRIAIPRLIPQHAQQRREPLDLLPHQPRVRLLLRYLLRGVRARVLDPQALQLGLPGEGARAVFPVGVRVALDLRECFGQPV